MAIVQEVENGKIVGETSEAAGSKKKTVSNEMGQDQFLQLLVAQMQYQDPLEPTSNTEWVAQMATFSMVESLNNMQDAFIQQSANGLVGKYVFINDGNGGYIKGKVDYITMQGGKTKLSVGDKLYDMKDLDTVSDEEYYQGAILAHELSQMIKLLPSEDNLTIQDEGLVKSAREAYDKMTESQKKFVEKDDMNKLTALETRMDALKATHLTGLVRKLPSESEIKNADAKTLKTYEQQYTDAQKYYDEMTERQKKNIADDTVTKLKMTAEYINAAQGPAGDGSGQPGDPDASGSDVSALLQKILEELQSQKQNQDSGDSPTGNEP